MKTLAAGILALAAAAGASGQVTPVPRLVDRADYADRLHAMWLGQCIANWTGLRTEGVRQHPPFYTDADWGHSPDGLLIDFVLSQDPWLADDDTDIEYVWIHALSTLGGTSLTGAQIASQWIDHVNRFIWVSNAKARSLMTRGVTPPATGIFTVNDQSLMIDAQLTTETFGMLCPGMPERALSIANLPIQTTASGYAAHAAQFYIVLYSLASQAPPGTKQEQTRWLFDQARRWIPSTSKAADVADFVLADYLANPDKNDWERTRDAVAQRYQANAAANGFVYRAWYESSVNFAAGCIGLLYGGGDYRRTVQICTLMGWDSDNATATLGGLLGFMYGTQGVTAQFPNQTFSDRFDIYRTRDDLPDYLPGDAAAQDTLTLLAQRMLPIIDREVNAAGGRVSGQKWLLPPAIRPGDELVFSPTRAEMDRSGTMRVKRAGGTVTGSSSVASSPPGGQGALGIPLLFANGVEEDFTGRELASVFDRGFYSSQNPNPPGPNVTLTVTYDRPVAVHTVRFIEGDHFAGGGWWASPPTVELQIGGGWVAPPGGVASMTPLNENVPFQIIDFVLGQTSQATGVRVRGAGGGPGEFVTCCEIDALSAPEVRTWPTFDLNGDGRVDVADVAYYDQHPADLDASGAADAADRRYLTAAVRWQATVADGR